MKSAAVFAAILLGCTAVSGIALTVSASREAQVHNTVPVRPVETPLSFKG